MDGSARLGGQSIDQAQTPINSKAVTAHHLPLAIETTPKRPDPDALTCHAAHAMRHAGNPSSPNQNVPRLGAIGWLMRMPISGNLSVIHERTSIYQ